MNDISRDPAAVNADTANLLAALADWQRMELAQRLRELELMRNAHVSPRLIDRTEADKRRWIDQQAYAVRPHLQKYLEDHSGKTADELMKLAALLSPDDTDGTLAQLVRFRCRSADRLLVAATIYYNWHRGKREFQFLPDPRTMTLAEYEAKAQELLEYIDDATNGDPRRILVGDDRAFYDSLPNRIAIYRGCAGVTPGQASAGVCWTTKRKNAEWFASRFPDAEKSVVVTARVRKTDVVLALASECEIVTIPRRASTIKSELKGAMPRPDDIKWMP